MNPPNDHEHSRRLATFKVALSVVGLLWAVYWCTLGVNEVFHGVFWNAQSWIAPYVMWGDGGTHYLLMLVMDNVAIGAFMFLAAKNPLAHKSLIDFSLVANGAHMASMIGMAAGDMHEHDKLLGDVPLGTIPTAILAWMWLRVRSLDAARAPERDVGPVLAEGT